MSYYCQPDVRNSYKFVILNFLANSSAVWLQFLDACRPFSVGIPTVFVDEGGFWHFTVVTLAKESNHHAGKPSLPVASTPHLRQVSHVTNASDITNLWELRTSA